MKKRIISIFLAGIFLGIPVHPALAKPGYSSVNRHLNFLKQNFTQNKSKEILEHLWQALVADPYAPEILPYLQKSLNELSLSAADRMRVVSIQDLLNQTRNLFEKRGYYAQKNDDLKQAILKEGVPPKSLNTFLGQLDGDIPDVFSDDAPASFLKDGSSWAELHKILNNEKASLQAEVTLLERQYQGLTRLHQHKMLVPASSSSSVMVMADQGLSERLPMVSEGKKGNSEDVRELIAGLQSQITAFQQDLRQKNDMINSLRSQVIDMNLNLAQRDKTLNDRINELADLRMRMDDVQARFDLGQKIIQEKDIQMDSMQKELSYVKNENNGLRGEMAVRLEEKDQQIQEMAGMLDIYWKKLNSVSDSAEKKDGDVEFLVERLLAMQDRLENKDEALQKTHQDLNSFEGQLKDMQNQIAASPQTADVSISQDVLDMEAKLRDVKSYLIQQIEENDALSRYLAEQTEQLDAPIEAVANSSIER